MILKFYEVDYTPKQLQVVDGFAIQFKVVIESENNYASSCFTLEIPLTFITNLDK